MIEQITLGKDGRLRVTPDAERVEVTRMHNYNLDPALYLGFNAMALVRLALRDGKLPRVHGNGFIQLDIDKVHRLHFWGHPSIPSQKVYTPIHDHLFAFDSHVLIGEITNLRYKVCPGILYRVWEAYQAKGDDTKLHPTDTTMALMVQEINHIKRGNGYHMPAYTFHQTIADRPSVTLVKKFSRTMRQNLEQDEESTRPQVLVPLHGSPDNTFDRHEHDSERLVAIITDIINEG